MKTDFNFVSQSLPKLPEPSELPEPPRHVAHLDTLAPGQRATIVSIDDSGPVGRRLLDLGLLPGTPVRALRYAPLGDPGVFELRGYRLCLRRTETARVRIRFEPGTGPGAA
jgi:Fe2+ transport system protein FeoA